MKIARAVKQKWRKASFEFAIKFLDQTRRRGKSKLWSPFVSIDDRQTQWLIPPGVIEMEVQSAAQKNCWDGHERNRVSFAPAKRRFFRLHAASAWMIECRKRGKNQSLWNHGFSRWLIVCTHF
jgi:hypothetical protein